MAQHNELGRIGEDTAVNYLKEKGFQIIERNTRCAKVEVDLIAKFEDYIVFVEIKTRSSMRWGNPEDAISKAKIKRMVEAAHYYIDENDIDLPVRFDIVAIVINKKIVEIEHFEDAFMPPLN